MHQTLVAVAVAVAVAAAEAEEKSSVSSEGSVVGSEEEEEDWPKLLSLREDTPLLLLPLPDSVELLPSRPAAEGGLVGDAGVGGRRDDCREREEKRREERGQDDENIYILHLVI